MSTYQENNQHDAEFKYFPSSASVEAHMKNNTNTQTTDNKLNNVISLSSRQYLNATRAAKIIQILPESSGVKMLYRTDSTSDDYITIPIICWALLEDHSVVGMAPWINKILDCETIAKEFDLAWDGFYDEASNETTKFPPGFAVAMLTTAARFNQNQPDAKEGIIQEIPDQMGTHAMLIDSVSKSMTLTHVVSWCLDQQGELHGMLADNTKVTKLPIVAGDPCLYPADQEKKFRCYFQRDIAEKIRKRDRSALDALDKIFFRPPFKSKGQ